METYNIDWKREMERFIFVFIFMISFGFSGLLEDMGIDSEASKRASNYELTKPPPPAPPAQHAGGEGIPPLPLPAVPLRRTEKKNPPRPPVLVAKLTTGDINDWANNPSDIDNLLKWMASEIKQNFSTINIPSNKVPSNPSEIPVLYRSGQKPFQFTDELRQKLRNYLLNGGTLILDSCCGSSDFAVSAMREIQKLIPERTPYRLSLDHPIYHSYYDINSIKFRPYAKEASARNNVPSIIGIDIGCRTAVFFFRYDISSGWQGRADTEDMKIVGYDIETSKLLGANLMAYISTEHNASIPLSQALNYIDEDKKGTAKFTIAQVIYSGIWKTRESGLSMLLDSFNHQTGTPVRFERIETKLDSPKIFSVPFLYISGHNRFILTYNERENLRRYVQRGGVLFAEACCGREGFNISFNEEMERIFDKKLERIENSELFYFPNNISLVSLRPALARELKVNGKVKPILYGIKNNGTYGVIYSPYGLSCGWELSQCPYCKGIESKDAIAIGVNVLFYTITQ